MAKNRPNPDFFLDEQMVSERIGVAVKTLQRMRSEHTGPDYLKAGGKPLYKPADVDAWLERSRNGGKRRRRRPIRSKRR
jgi:hypothetical protein